MSDQDTVRANDHAPDDEYDELVRLIVDGGWTPGDIIRTSKGGTWQFRRVPYTSDFPEVDERHASGEASKDDGRLGRPHDRSNSVLGAIWVTGSRIRPGWLQEQRRSV